MPVDVSVCVSACVCVCVRVFLSVRVSFRFGKFLLCACVSEGCYGVYVFVFVHE